MDDFGIKNAFVRLAGRLNHIETVTIHDVPRADFDALPCPANSREGVVWKICAGVTFYMALESEE